ncbi:MAG: sugar phosphate isomerase/epimerase [Planctomycetaceae bacterium]
MILSISCRIAESFLSKEVASLTFEEFADVAVAAGYDAVCMRASQIGVQSSPEQVQRARQILDERKLKVTMISGDFDIVYNNERGPNCLYNVEPYLDLAETLGAKLIRVCIKKPEDLVQARYAAEQAAVRGLHLVHQCHVQSLFETVPEIISCIEQIDHPNFGLIFEAANLEQCGQDYGPETIAKLAPWIRNVYFQNQKMHAGGQVELATWCQGPVNIDLIEIHEPDGIDFDSVFEGLRNIGYDGPVTVHQSGPEDGELTAAEAAKLTAEFLKQRME